jgi:hypothetical protein
MIYNAQVNAGGSYNSECTGYGEYFEWDTVPTSDATGKFVTLTTDAKITIANDKSTFILGVINNNCAFIGNSLEDSEGKWQTDNFGKAILSDNDSGINYSRIMNVELGYTNDSPYVDRYKSSDYAVVCMKGTTNVYDDGTCTPGTPCSIDANGVATKNALGQWMVIKRVSTKVVKIIL